MSSSIGLIGLAVMGQNLALNIADHGFSISVYNRTADTTQSFHEKHQHTQIHPCYSLTDFVSSLTSPRVILLMVKAGNPVDQIINSLLPLLAHGDIIIDGGNSHYDDTAKRFQQLRQQGIRFVGMGISGGEEGARNGPSIMPGGDHSAWPIIQPIFQSIAAQVDDQPCCEWLGESAAGHYVKMVHNGIEYGDMQLITEAYSLLRQSLRQSPKQLQQSFAEWNQGVLESYLIEITADILNSYDEQGRLVLDSILDKAAQKGTGKWTAISALDEAVPLSLITQAVFARFLSAEKTLRQQAAQHFSAPGTNKALSVENIRHALYAAKILSYTQGFMLMQKKSQAEGWAIDYAAVAKLWRGGCIIRSRFLNNIAHAFAQNPELPCLIFDDFFQNAIKQSQSDWRHTVCIAIQQGIAVPAMASALNFFDGLRTENSAANLLQAQRDYFGAHTYQRIDTDEEQFFHSDWQALRKGSV